MGSTTGIAAGSAGAKSSGSTLTGSIGASVLALPAMSKAAGNITGRPMAEPTSKRRRIRAKLTALSEISHPAACLLTEFRKFAQNLAIRPKFPPALAETASISSQPKSICFKVIIPVNNWAKPTAKSAIFFNIAVFFRLANKTGKHAGFEPRYACLSLSNCSSKTMFEPGKSMLRTYSADSVAPCSRSIPPSSHSTESGPW